MNNDLGEILKERRKSKKLTLKQVADLSGVSMSHLARIERGERFPSGRILRKLAKAEPLGFTEVELFRQAGYLSRDESKDRKEAKMIEIERLSNGKAVYIDGEGFTTEEAHEIIIRLTKVWGNDFEKQELKDMALGIEK